MEGAVAIAYAKRMRVGRRTSSERMRRKGVKEACWWLYAGSLLVVTILSPDAIGRWTPQGYTGPIPGSFPGAILGSFTGSLTGFQVHFLPSFPLRGSYRPRYIPTNVLLYPPSLPPSHVRIMTANARMMRCQMATRLHQ